VTIAQAVEAVQFAYPQIYYACHTRHDRQRSSGHELSQRDSAILVHLDRAAPMRLTDLARHLDLAASTLSETITKLADFGFVEKTSKKPGDRRAVEIRLTQKGIDGVCGVSVLEASRLTAVLRRMNPSDRKRAIDGLSLFARACRKS